MPEKLVSIHAPVWVRLALSSVGRNNGMFQFTHPCGCDAVRRLKLYCVQVSIHAPVWVRPVLTVQMTVKDGFQFTHPCGCDDCAQLYVAAIFAFQFTHPCGCDGLTNTV